MDVSEIHGVHHVSTTVNTEESKKKEKARESHTRHGMQVRQCGQSRKGYSLGLSPLQFLSTTSRAISWC